MESAEGVAAEAVEAAQRRQRERRGLAPAPVQAQAPGKGEDGKNSRSGEARTGAHVMFAEDDLPFEEELLRNPQSLKGWTRYVEHRAAKTSAAAESAADAAARRAKLNMVFERALKELPGSYKLWYGYLKARRSQVRSRCLTDPAYQEVNNAFERALVFMHKMPRIWLDYCAFLMLQKKVTRLRRVFDRALRALPITQHERIWKVGSQDSRLKTHKCNVMPLLLLFFSSPALHRVRQVLPWNRGDGGAGLPQVPAALPGGGGGVHRVPKVYRQVREKYEECEGPRFDFYFKKKFRLDEAAILLAKVVNNQDFVSKRGKSNHALW